jgi:hypothetical protein
MNLSFEPNITAAETLASANGSLPLASLDERVM